MIKSKITIKVWSLSKKDFIKNQIVKVVEDLNPFQLSMGKSSTHPDQDRSIVFIETDVGCVKCSFSTALKLLRELETHTNNLYNTHIENETDEIFVVEGKNIITDYEYVTKDLHPLMAKVMGKTVETLEYKLKSRYQSIREERIAKTKYEKREIFKREFLRFFKGHFVGKSD